MPTGWPLRTGIRQGGRACARDRNHGKEIISTVRARRAPMMHASASLAL